LVDLLFGVAKKNNWKERSLIEKVDIRFTGLAMPVERTTSTGFTTTTAAATATTASSTIAFTTTLTGTFR
jgi:hypothetical protein